MRWLLLIVVLILPACLLDSEDCGQAFQLSKGQCVPKVEPAPFRPERVDSANRDGAFTDLEDGQINEIEGGVLDAEQQADATILSPFSAFDQILLVDRTEVSDSRPTPALPGCDIDAVLIIDADNEIVGTATEILDHRINDPFDSNVQKVPRAALGMPDGRAVSVGPQGFLRMRLSLDAPMKRSDSLTIVELAERPEDLDRYEVFICTRDSEALDGCRSLGEGASGRTRFSLDIQ